VLQGEWLLASYPEARTSFNVWNFTDKMTEYSLDVTNNFDFFLGVRDAVLHIRTESDGESRILVVCGSWLAKIWLTKIRRRLLNIYAASFAIEV